MSKMSEQDLAISVRGVYKDFRLPHQKTSTIKGLFTGLFKTLVQHQTIETQHALRDIDFEIKKGEFFGIVGRNGSGKSTLLKLLAGIYQPTKGKIRVRGKLVPFIELGVGFNPELSGRENIYLNGALLGFSQGEIDNMYDEIVEFAELEQFMDQKLKNYSSGMQVRLAFSMAVRAQADILLIDEVLAVGDADFQRKCFEYFNQLKKEKKTVVFVSHDMDAVQKYCDRAMLLEKNTIVDISNTTEIAKKYLRLFSNENSDNAANKYSGKRWGNQRIKIIKQQVRVNPNIIEVTELIRATEDTLSPLMGIRVRSSAGQSITGTNSKLEQVNIPNLKTGQTIKLEWQIPNIFSDGKYYIDLAITNADGTVVLDWWDEAVVFTVHRDRPIPYPIDPKFSLTLE
jgi:ABC-2 type transport system ATP-binding protein